MKRNIVETYIGLLFIGITLVSCGGGESTSNESLVSTPIVSSEPVVSVTTPVPVVNTLDDSNPEPLTNLVLVANNIPDIDFDTVKNSYPVEKVSFCNVQEESSTSRPDIGSVGLVFVNDVDRDGKLTGLDINDAIKKASVAYQNEKVIQRVILDELHPDSYFINFPIKIPSGVVLDGKRKRIILLPEFQGRSAIEIVANAINAGIQNVNLEIGGKPRIGGIRIGDNSSKIYIYDNIIVDEYGSALEEPGNGSHLSMVYLLGKTTDLYIHNNTFSGFATGILLRGLDAENIHVAHNIFKDWRNFGILMVARSAPMKVIRISHNQFLPPIRGFIKNPIGVQNLTDSQSINDVVVNNNILYGNDEPHIWEYITRTDGTQIRDATINAATSDMITFRGVDNFEISQNCLYNAGETGIMVARGASNGVVKNNLIVGADIAGIGVGVPRTEITSDIAILDNIIENPSRNRAEDLPSWALQGIGIVQAKDIVLKGNIISQTEELFYISDDSSPRTIQNGVTIWENQSTNIELIDNTYSLPEYAKKVFYFQRLVN